MTMASLTSAAREMRELKTEKTATEARLTEINNRLKEVETQIIPGLMDELEVEKFTVEGVGTVFQQVKVYAYVKKEDEGTFHGWLREQGHGDLIRAYVFPPTLNAFAKEQDEAGVGLPDWLKVSRVPTAMLRKK